jgi:hypothetical protein
MKRRWRLEYVVLEFDHNSYTKSVEVKQPEAVSQIGDQIYGTEAEALAAAKPALPFLSYNDRPYLDIPNHLYSKSRLILETYCTSVRGWYDTYNRRSFVVSSRKKRQFVSRLPAYELLVPYFERLELEAIKYKNLAGNAAAAARQQVNDMRGLLWSRLATSLVHETWAEIEATQKLREAQVVADTSIAAARQQAENELGDTLAGFLTDGTQAALADIQAVTDSLLPQTRQLCP